MLLYYCVPSSDVFTLFCLFLSVGTISLNSLCDSEAFAFRFGNFPLYSDFSSQFVYSNLFFSFSLFLFSLPFGVFFHALNKSLYTVTQYNIHIEHVHPNRATHHHTGGPWHNDWNRLDNQVSSTWFLLCTEWIRYVVVLFLLQTSMKNVTIPHSSLPIFTVWLVLFDTYLNRHMQSIGAIKIRYVKIVEYMMTNARVPAHSCAARNADRTFAGNLKNQSQCTHILRAKLCRNSRRHRANIIAYEFACCQMLWWPEEFETMTFYPNSPWSSISSENRCQNASRRQQFRVKFVHS